MPTAYNGPPHCSTCGTPKSVCTWTEDDLDGVWRTDCVDSDGKHGAWVFNVGGPSANGMRFCCFCGGPLIEKPYVWETDDEDEERERATNGAIEQELEEGR